MMTILRILFSICVFIVCAKFSYSAGICEWENTEKGDYLYHVLNWESDEFGNVDNDTCSSGLVTGIIKAVIVIPDPVAPEVPVDSIGAQPLDLYDIELLDSGMEPVDILNSRLHGRSNVKIERVYPTHEVHLFNEMYRVLISNAGALKRGRVVIVVYNPCSFSGKKTVTIPVNGSVTWLQINGGYCCSEVTIRGNAQ